MPKRPSRTAPERALARQRTGRAHGRATRARVMRCALHQHACATARHARQRSRPAGRAGLPHAPMPATGRPGDQASARRPGRGDRGPTRATRVRPKAARASARDHGEGFSRAIAADVRTTRNQKTCARTRGGQGSTGATRRTGQAERDQAGRARQAGLDRQDPASELARPSPARPSGLGAESTLPPRQNASRWLPCVVASEPTARKAQKGLLSRSPSSMRRAARALA